MYTTLHPRDDVDRLYVSIKAGRSGLASIKDNVDTSIQQPEDYIEKHRGRLITATWNNTDNTRINWKEIAKNNKEKKNNSMDVLSDLQVTYHTRKRGRGKERDILREKLNLY